MTMEMQISTPTPMNIACRTPFLARFTFFAPRFCPTKVGYRLAHALGRQDRELVDLRVAAPARHNDRGTKTVDICLYQSIGKRCESLLTLAGSPIRKISPRHVLLICKSLKTSLWAPSVLVSVMQARNAETVSAITVAIATPLILCGIPPQKDIQNNI